MTDFIVIDGGSVKMLIPQTDQAKDWTAENINIDDWQNSNRIAVEWRYFAELAAGITDAGLTLAFIPE